MSFFLPFLRVHELLELVSLAPAGRALTLALCAASFAACEHNSLDTTPPTPQVQVFTPGAPMAERHVPVSVVGVSEPRVKALPMLRSMVAPSPAPEAGR